MRKIYTCKDCRVIIECEDNDRIPPEGWHLIEQVDNKKSWFCEGCSGQFKPKEPRSTNYANDLKNMNFKNKGEFYTACLKFRKLNKSQVDVIVKGYDLNVVPQLKLAWLEVLKA